MALVVQQFAGRKNVPMRIFYKACESHLFSFQAIVQAIFVLEIQIYSTNRGIGVIFLGASHFVDRRSGEGRELRKISISYFPRGKQTHFCKCYIYTRIIALRAICDTQNDNRVRIATTVKGAARVLPFILTTGSRVRGSTFFR